MKLLAYPVGHGFAH